MTHEYLNKYIQLNTLKEDSRKLKVCQPYTATSYSETCPCFKTIFILYMKSYKATSKSW